MVSQPNPFAEGQTILVPRTDISVSQDGLDNIAQLSEAATLSDLVDGLNAQSMIDIITTVHASGALHADLIIQ
jgi:flagellar P-ring protein precursor FlgI